MPVDKLLWNTRMYPGCVSASESAAELGRRLTDAQATVEALQAKYNELLEALDCVLAERPLPSGEYVHRVSCNGDRRKPAGTVGISCSCRVGQQQVEALQRERVKALKADPYKQGFADALEKVASDWASKEFRGHDEIQGAEVQAFLDTRHVHYEECRGVKPLQTALDAEREKAKTDKEMYFSTIVDLRTELSQLQAAGSAIMKALRAMRDNKESWYTTVTPELMNAWDMMKASLGRATLDATTPATTKT